MAEHKPHAEVMADLRTETEEAEAEWVQAAADAGLDPLETRLALIEARLDFYGKDIASTSALLQHSMHGDFYGPQDEVEAYHVQDGRMYGYLWALAKLRGEEPPD